MGAFSGFLTVALGAFGAHMLEGQIDEHQLLIYQKSSYYMGLHGLGLLAVGLWLQHHPSPWLRRAGWSFGLGILLFCGSLYAIAFGGPSILGIITPIGGTAFLMGWLALAIAAWRSET
ncbi:MAG: DUF423 domain-containing protein [Gammaproteobacteria bacterium]|nr:DUF423 domain-containing protein [Gammaproteobacteria bacterium]